MDFCSMPKQGDFAELPERDFNYLNLANLPFIDKVLTMANMLQLTNQELHERQIVVRNIMNLLEPFYPDCEVMIFGSSMNGFGFRDCDLDLLFLPFPGYCNLDKKANVKDNKNDDEDNDNEKDNKNDGENDNEKDNKNDNEKDNANDTVPSPFEVLQGLYPREQLLDLKEEYHLKFVQRILRKKRNFFRRILYIPAKCPILNIQFVRNSFTCDFSASNRLVTSNTELLWFFGTFDFRVKPLVTVLRYWAKSLGFIAKSLLSSYAFTLLVIFYLQNTDPPILPSVKSLNEISGYSRVIDGWETAVCLDRIHISQAKNSANIAQLFIGFFDFYWNFDFIQNVVSIYHGKALPVEELNESTDDRIRMFKVTPLSIQDAFVLSHNVSRNSDMKTSFKLALLIAKKLMPTENIPFQSLFKYSLYQEEMAGMYEATKKSLPHYTCFPVYLNYDLNCRLGVTSQLYPWYRKVQEVVLDVLQYGLLAECEVVDKAVWNDKHKAKKKKNINVENVGKLQLIMSIQCTFHYDTIGGRNHVKEVDLESDNDDTELPSLLRREFQISKHLIKKKILDVFPSLRVMCQCYKYTSMQIPDVIVTFSSLTDNSDFREQTGPQLNSFVKKNVRKMLEEDLFVQVGKANKRRQKRPLGRNPKRPMKGALFVKGGISNKKKKKL